MASSIQSLPIHRFPLPPSCLSNKVSSENNGVISDPVTDPSKHENPSKSNKRVKIVIKHPKQHHLLTAVEGNGSEPTISKESSSLRVTESKPTQLDDDQKIIVPQPREKIVTRKKKERALLSKEEIEEDIAAIKALAPSKRLRRPKPQPRDIFLQGKLDLLFPGLG